MEDKNKTNKQLISELADLRQKNAELVKETGRLNSDDDFTLVSDKVSSSEKYHALAEAQKIAHLGCWEWNIQDNSETWSEEQFRIFGYEPGEVNPSHDLFIELVHPGDRDRVFKAVEKVLAGAEPSKIEFRVIRPNKTERIIISQGEVVRDKEGNPLKMIGTVFDITNQKKIEQAEKKYHDFVQNSVEAVWAYDLEPPLPMDLTAEEQLNLLYERAYITEANDALACMLGYEKGEELLGMRLDDFQPRTNPENVAYVKNVVREKFNVTDFETTAFGLSGEKRIMFSNILGIVEDGKLLRIWGTSRDITDAKVAEENLRQTEQRYRTVADYTYDWEYWERPDGSLEYVSPSCNRITEYTVEEFVNEPSLLKDIILPEYREEWDTYQDDIFAGKQPKDIEIKIRTKKGSIAWVEHAGQLIIDNIGNNLGYRASTRDITARKKLEENVHRRDERFHAFVENSTEAIYCFELGWPLDISLPEDEQIDHLYKYAYVSEANDTWARLAGLKHGKDLIGFHLEEILPRSIPENINFIKEMIRARYRLNDYETVEIYKTGVKIHASNTLSGIIDNGHLLRVWGTGRDITEQLQKEKIIQESEERLKRAQSVAGIGFLDWNLKTNVIFWSDELYNLFGVEKTEGEQTIETTVALVHPDDLDFVQKNLNEAVQGTKEYNIEHRILRPDSRIVWVHSHAELVHDPDGNPESLLGTVVDITDRKQIENELIASQKDLQKLAGHLIVSQEKELSGLARELHDDITQRLAVLAIEAGSIEKDFKELPGPVLQKVARIKEQLIKMSKDVHDISRDIHPSILDDLGLERAIQSECGDFSSRTGIAVIFTPKNIPRNISKEISLPVYRIIQEGLANIVKHADTKNAYVFLEGSDDRLILAVRDTGVGFDHKKVRKMATLGLGGIRERVRLVDGKSSIISNPGKGTAIEVSIPYKRRDA